MNTLEDKLTPPLLSWDIYINSFKKIVVNSKKRRIIEELNVFKDKFNWVDDVQELICNTDFEAVVLTDQNQQIQYVSKEFFYLTGYSFSYVKGHTPKLLQGEKTCLETSKRIKHSIIKKEPFKEQVINYRKNGSEYNCFIEVSPIRNKNNEVTHFIALEREI